MDHIRPRSRRVGGALRPRPGALTVLALGTGLLASSQFATADDHGTYHFQGLAPGCQLFGAGSNSPGQLGGGSANDRQSTPLQFGGPPPAADGGGAGSSSASYVPDPTPFLVETESITAISPVTSTFVSTSDGRVFGSGRNAVGQLGQGDFGQRDSPVQWPLPDGETAADVVTDIRGKVAYVRTVSGKVFGAGYNAHGQLGNGTVASGDPAGVATPVQLALPEGERASKVVPAPDGSAVFVLTESGKVYGAGMNDQGQLGTSGPSALLTHLTDNPATGGWDLEVPSPGSEHHRTPVLFELPAGKTAVDVVPGSGWTMVRTTDGEVYGAGSNGDGRLGSTDAGTGAPQRLPVRFELPAGALAEEVHVSTAVPSFSNRETTATTDPDGSTYVTTTDGRMFGAGSNGHGQLGNASAAATQTAPVQFALPAGEKVHEWYVGSIIPHGAPFTTYDGGPTYQATSGEPVSVYVLTDSGRVFGAGDNSWGQLGNGTLTGTLGANPVEFDVPDGEEIVDVTIGADEDSAGVTVYSGTTYGGDGIVAAARTASGKVFGAGSNKDGQLGIGTLGGDGSITIGFGQFGHATPVPFALPEGEVATDVTASSNGVSVVTATGKVFGAGINEHGELGDGTVTTSYDPVTSERRSAGVPTPALFDLPGLSRPPAPRIRLAAAGADDQPWRARWAIRREAWSAGSGSFSTPYTFVLACPAVMSLGEIVFEDGDDNGRRDAGERGVAGVTVRLSREGESVPLQTTTTNAAGYYLFNELTPGGYIVEIVVPDGYRSSTDPTSGATPNDDTALDDNGVDVNGTTVRSKTVTLDWLGERVLEKTAEGATDRAVDADSNVTVGFGINRIPPPASPPSPTRQGTPQAPTPEGPPLRATSDRTALTIRKVAQRARVPQGQQVTYRITVRNTGRDAARKVVVCDRLPESLALVTTRAENARVRFSNGQVCASWGTLLAREGRTVTLTTRVARQAETGPLVNASTARAANARTVTARSVVVVTGVTGGALPAVTG